MEAALEGIQRFLRREDEPPKELTEKEKEQAESRPLAYDLLIDADIIQADFQREYGIDLTTADMHWWRFMALLEGLYSYKFSDRVGFRVSDLTGIKDAKQRKSLQKKKNLFRIHKGGMETVDDQMAYLQSIIDKHKEEN